MMPGELHTKLLGALTAELRRQHPSLFHEGSDAEIWIPTNWDTEITRIDVSRLAEAVIGMIEGLDAPISDGWQTIDSAPRDGTWFVAYRPDAGVFAATWHHPAHEDGGWDVEAEPILFDTSGGDLTGSHPTRWMPLPAPPEVKS